MEKVLKYFGLQIIMILVSMNSICQVPMYIDSLLNKRMAVIVVTYVGANGTTIIKNGMGLMLDNEHFGTCYHVINDTLTKVSIIVYYNFKKIFLDPKDANTSAESFFFNTHFSFGFLNTHDSVIINFNSKSYKRAVTSTPYDKNSFCTDYIVLPLSKKVACDIPEFDTSGINFKEELYAAGPDQNSSFFPVHFYPLTKVNKFKDQDCEITTFYGHPGHGFSGAPVYTKNGKIVGIIQSGYENFPAFISNLHSLDIITKQQLKYIMAIYENNAGDVGYFIRMKIFLSRLQN